MFRRAATRMALMTRPLAVATSARNCAPMMMTGCCSPAASLGVQRRFVNLNEECRNELAEEEGRTDKAPCPALPDGGWTVNHESGNSTFSMKRVWNDETHEIYAQLQVQDPEVAENPDAQGEVAQQFPFTFLVTRKNKTIDFTLNHVQGELVIDLVTVYDDPSLARDFSVSGMHKKETKYQGPSFSELNGTVVDGFVAFLEQRGIDDNFSNFIAQYSYWMEQEEYEGWLKKMIHITE